MRVKKKREKKRRVRLRFYNLIKFIVIRLISWCPCVRECVVCVVLCVHPHISTFQWTHCIFRLWIAEWQPQYRRAQSPPNDVFLLRFFGVKRTAYLTRDVQKKLKKDRRREKRVNRIYIFDVFAFVLFSLFPPLSHSSCAVSFLAIPISGAVRWIGIFSTVRPRRCIDAWLM